MTPVHTTLVTVDTTTTDAAGVVLATMTVGETMTEIGIPAETMTAEGTAAAETMTEEGMAVEGITIGGMMIEGTMTGGIDIRRYLLSP